MQKFDYVIIGSGLGGLLTGALLASIGKSVCILEKHYAIGGYAHSFGRDGYEFCAGLHYVFNCLEDEDGGIFLRKIGLGDKVQFRRMNPDGFDKLRFPDLQYDIKKGVERNIQDLAKMFPEHEKNLRKYYSIITSIYESCLQYPLGLPTVACIPKAFSLYSMFKYRKWTAKDLFDKLQFPQELQDILIGQCGNIALAAEEISLIAHAGNVIAYDRGAAFPAVSYTQFVSSIANFIRRKDGCVLKPLTSVEKIDTNNNNVTSVITSKGEEIVGDRYLFNGDPKSILKLTEYTFPKKFLKKLQYDYSAPSITCYMGLKNIDLAKYGFGNWNIWHYPHQNIDEIYRKQLRDCNVDNPFLAITTPTLHAGEHNSMAPKGCHQMVICTWVGYEKMRKLKDASEEVYLQEKEKITNTILDIIENNYIPNFRDHIDVIEVGTPTTNEFYANSPEGNCYGMKMDPKNFKIGKIGFHTPVQNLFLINATTGLPGLGGAFRSSLMLYAELEKDKEILREVYRQS